MAELIDKTVLSDSSDYEESLLADYSQLCFRINELTTLISKRYLGYVNSPVRAKVETLIGQLSSMQSYKHAFEKRLKEEGIVF